MGRPFNEEIDHLPKSIEWALSLEIRELKRAVTASAGCNLMTVGSGGSSTAAAFMAMLHEHSSGDLSRSLTPLAYALLPTGLKNFFSVLLSAEGKNKDILAVASQLASSGGRGILMTLTKSNPLVSKALANGSPTPFTFEMPWAKDGYLATNSLIAMMVIIARAYSRDEEELSNGLKGLNSTWIADRQVFYSGSVNSSMSSSARQIIVLYGEQGRVAAVDIESKLAESALSFCQPVDYRQFAHGRHLQLKKVDDSPTIVALISPSDSTLANATLELLPKHVDVLRIFLPADPALAEIVGVVEAMLLTQALAARKIVDPGQPDVPEFGRLIHSLDLSTLVTPTAEPHAIFFQRKLPSLRPEKAVPLQLSMSMKTVLARLAASEFRGLVCDFDGTFCDTNLRYGGVDARLVPQIERLLEAGVRVGFATGRGDSLQKDLREKISERYWPDVLIGYYSGSNTMTLDQDFTPPGPDPKFAELETWLQATGAIADCPPSKAHGGQFGIGCPSIQTRSEILAAVNYWIASVGAVGWRAFASGHSVDVLSEMAGKENVVDAMLAFAGCKRTEVLRIGDSGHFAGNDFELLNSNLGLSVDRVSGLPDVCWNFLPVGKSNTLGTLHYLTSLQVQDGKAKFAPQFFSEIDLALNSKNGAAK